MAKQSAAPAGRVVTHASMLCAAGFVWIAGTVVQLANAEVLVTRPQPVAITYFGLHMHEAGNTTTWPEVPFGAWRLWDAYVSWSQLEPARERWDFQRLDRYLALAQKNDVELLLPLGLSPSWASARPAEKSAYGPGNAAEPRHIEDWRRYVETVALRYRGRIRGYEIWNEPNLPNFFSGSAEDVLRLAREAYRIIKRIDPNAIVVSPSVTGGQGGIPWLERYFLLGGAQYADVIGYHLYVSPQPPEAALPVIRAVQQLMAKHGVDKPLWNTEAGWVMANREAIADPTMVGFDSTIKPLPEELAAAYVARSLILVWAAGVQRYYWYAWDNQAMGLIEPRSKAGKPAAQAYAQTAAWLTGRILQDCRSTADGIWTCTFSYKEGTRSRVLWRPAGPLRIPVPKEWQAVEYQALDGTVGKLPSNPYVEIGPAPVLVGGAARPRG